MNAARQTFDDLSARPDLDRCDAQFGPRDTTTGPTVVSPREQQVLRRVARGMTNQDIANDLFISIKTVERHLSNLFNKLHVANRAEATAAAYEHDLL